MNKYEKDYKHYGLGIEEQTTREHPWGKGATGRFTPKEMVVHARRKGLSYKDIYRKLHAQVALRAHKRDTRAYKIFKRAEEIAHREAAEHKEFKKSRIAV